LESDEGGYTSTGTSTGSGAQDKDKNEYGMDVDSSCEEGAGPCAANKDEDMTTKHAASAGAAAEAEDKTPSTDDTSVSSEECAGDQQSKMLMQHVLNSAPEAFGAAYSSPHGADNPGVVRRVGSGNTRGETLAVDTAKENSALPRQQGHVLYKNVSNTHKDTTCGMSKDTGMAAMQVLGKDDKMSSVLSYVNNDSSTGSSIHSLLSGTNSDSGTRRLDADNHIVTHPWVQACLASYSTAER
jgi:hypothetical protein